MKIAVLGTGIVGRTIGSKLIELGHDVMLGSRSETNQKGIDWAVANGSHATIGTFSNAAAFGEIVFCCTNGSATMDILKMAGHENLNGKVLIDVTNPLDFSKGMPPSLFVCNTDSLSEMIQREYPEVKVVKSLNTITASGMVNPMRIPGAHDIFMCGNDAQAKETVKQILESFGWKIIIDMGDITAARGLEMLMPFWLRMWGVVGNADFNYHIARK